MKLLIHIVSLLAIGNSPLYKHLVFMNVGVRYSLMSEVYVFDGKAAVNAVLRIATKPVSVEPLFR